VSGWPARMRLDARIVSRSGPRAWASRSGEGLGRRRPRRDVGGEERERLSHAVHAARCVHIRLLAASRVRCSGAVDGSEEQSARLIGGAHVVRYAAARRGLIAAAEDADAEVQR
jgi:hypothetical protein